MILSVFITGVCGFLLIIYLNQEEMIYIPNSHDMPGPLILNPIGFRNPKEYELPYEDAYIQCYDDIKIHGWLIIQPENIKKDCYTILYFHGNAGNIGNRLPYAKMLYDKLKCNILLVDYHGYGNSEGTPSEKYLQYDALASLDYLYDRDDINNNSIIYKYLEIIVFGRSLGGSVATYLAYKRSVLLLIIYRMIYLV